MASLDGYKKGDDLQQSEYRKDLELAIADSKRPWSSSIERNIERHDCSQLLRRDLESISPVKRSDREVNSIFITGSTGFLGATLLTELLLSNDLSSTRVKPLTIYCLVRSRSVAEGWAKLKQIVIRANASLVSSSSSLNDNSEVNYNPNQQLLLKIFEASSPLIDNDNKENMSPRIVLVCGDLSKERCGLSPEEFSVLGSECDLIFHVGNVVHWEMQYRHIRATNVLGTVEILRLAQAGRRNSGPATPIVYLSSISASMRNTERFEKQSLEKISADGSDESELLFDGYTLSKIVSENYLVDAANGLSCSTLSVSADNSTLSQLNSPNNESVDSNLPSSDALPVVIVRPGMIGQHITCDHLNTAQMFERYVSSIILAKIVPEEFEKPNDDGVDEIASDAWQQFIFHYLPVDYVARSILSIALTENQQFQLANAGKCFNIPSTSLSFITLFELHNHIRKFGYELGVSVFVYYYYYYYYYYYFVMDSFFLLFLSFNINSHFLESVPFDHWRTILADSARDYPFRPLVNQLDDQCSLFRRPTENAIVFDNFRALSMNHSQLAITQTEVHAMLNSMLIRKMIPAVSTEIF
jgi:thioester reductase-like protein